MIPRKISRLLQERLAQYPAVALVGPRQSGKTTLARSLGGIYFDCPPLCVRTGWMGWHNLSPHGNTCHL